MVSRARDLESKLESGALAEFCASAAASSSSSSSSSSWEADYWHFVGAHFAPSPRDRWLELLGYEKGLLASKAAQLQEDIAEVKRLNEKVAAASVVEVCSYPMIVRCL